MGLDMFGAEINFYKKKVALFFAAKKSYKEIWKPEYTNLSVEQLEIKIADLNHIIELEGSSNINSAFSQAWKEYEDAYDEFQCRFREVDRQCCEDGDPFGVTAETLPEERYALKKLKIVIKYAGQIEAYKKLVEKLTKIKMEKIKKEDKKQVKR